MKTKFFKKLSFVLVVAMVLSLFVPAAGAFASSGAKLNSTNKYLHLGVDKLDNYNFNISGKKSGWKYFWESANEDVATVNEKNGVTTATGVGKTKVTVTITDKDGEEVDTLTANVTVRDNIETVKISNPVEKLNVGEEHDYNRSFVTRSGSTKKTSAITRWTVDSDTETINDKGVFVPTEAGEYTITARSFQSAARYKAWQEDPVKYADYVLDFDTTTVVVAGNITGVDQVDLVSFKVNFDSVMDEEEVKNNLKVSLVIGEVTQEQYVKSIKLDDTDKSVAIVEMYNDLNKGRTYVVDYPNMDRGQFTAVSTNFSDVVKMVIDTKNVVASTAGGEETAIEFSLYDINGVNITKGRDSEYNGDLTDRVTFSTESSGAHVYDNKIVIYEVGTVADVKGVYNTYSYDDQGKELGTVYAADQIVGTKEASVQAGSLNKATITFEGKEPDWKADVVHSVAIGSANPRLYAMVKDSDGKEIDSQGEDGNGFKFESTDDNALYVLPNGEIIPIKDGASAVVVIKFGDTIVGNIRVSVLPESKAVSFALSDYAFSLSTAETAAQTKTVEVTLKDQYGNDATAKDATIKALTTTNSVDGNINAVINGKKIEFSVDYDGVVAGKAVYEVEFNGMKRTVTVTLTEPNHKTDADIRYRIEMDKTIDLAIEKAENLDKKLDIKLVGYAPNGVKVYANVASSAAITIGDGTKLVNGQALYTVSGGAITKIDTGTYKVVAEYNGKSVGTEYFSVVDTQTAATYSIENVYYNGDSKEAVVAESFKFKAGDVDLNTDDILEVDAIDANIARSTFVRSVKIKQFFGTDYIVHTVNIGVTLYKK